MLALSLGLGLRSSTAVKAPDLIVTRLTHRLYGAGNAAETSVLTGDGTAKTYSATFVNNSGADITTGSVAFAGWGLTASGTQDCGNDYVVTGNIEYPVGGTTTNITQGGSTNVNVANGTSFATDKVALATVIPNGASFKVNLSTTPANGVKYMIRLGFCGVLSTAKKSLFAKEVLYAVGDSIATNNGGAVYNAASGKCGAFCATIGGTTAQTYGASSAANFVKQVALAQILGVTRFISNFGTNDYGSGVTYANLVSYVQAMRTLANAVGIKFTQATMLPRTVKPANMSVTSATYAGNVMTVVVADATKFVVDKLYSISGATQTEYNGGFICSSVNTGTNTLTFPMASTANTTATGTITITASYYNGAAEWQTPYNGNYNAGAGSARGQWNAYIRAGNFDGYVEWSDPFESSRDSGRWAIGGEVPLTADTQTCAVVSGSPLTTTRFQTNFSLPNSVSTGGTLQFTSGANIGLKRTINGNTLGDITVTSAFTSIPAVGDTFKMTTGASWTSDDGTHPRVAVGTYGGQAILNKAMGDYITSIL